MESFLKAISEDKKFYELKASSEESHGRIIYKIKIGKDFFTGPNIRNIKAFGYKLYSVDFDDNSISFIKVI